MKAGENLLRADPFAPAISLYFMGMALYVLGRYEAAVSRLTEIVEKAAAFPLPRRLLAASLAQLGRVAEAQTHAQIAMTAEPGWTISQGFVPSVPHLLPEQVAHVVEGLKKAGLPE